MSDVPITPKFGIEDQVTVGSNSIVGTIKDIRHHRSSGLPQYKIVRNIGTGPKADWIGEGPHIHLVKSATSSVLEEVEAAMDAERANWTDEDDDKLWTEIVEAEAVAVADKMKATDEFPTSDDGYDPRSGTVYAPRPNDHTSSPVEATISAPLSARVGIECEECGRIYGEQHHECPFCREDEFKIADILGSDDVGAQHVAPDVDDDDFAMPTDELIADLYRQRDEWQRKAEDARREAKSLEKKYVELQSMVTTRQPIAPQAECYQIKTLSFKVGLPDDDARYAQLLNDGWKENSVTSVITSGDMVCCVVVFKKQILTPTTPTRGSASAAAFLTSEFPARQMQPDAVLQPVRSIQLGPIGTSVKEIGVEATGQMMTDFAMQKAFANAQQRIDSMPVFNRSLHSLKASN